MITGLLLGPAAVIALPAKLRHQVSALPNPGCGRSLPASPSLTELLALAAP